MTTSTPRRSRRALLVHLLIVASAGLLTLLAMACEGPVEFKHTTKFNAVLNTTGKFQEAGEPGGVAATDVGPVTISYGVPVDLAAQNPELVDYAESGLFTETTVDQVTYKVTQNTLNTDLTNIAIAIGPTDVSDPNAEGAHLIAVIPEIKAGATPTGDAEVFPDNAPLIAEQVQTLQFGVATGADMSVKAGDPVPSGNAQIEIQLFMTFVADPL